ncbi:MAG: histidinol-phosphate transaminase [Micrococcales bacterium]|nr:histidinol-phosphate transaminase [Micrococcales bacterium]
MSKPPLRPSIETLPVYVPGKKASPGIGAFKLSSNESPFPPLPGVLAAVIDAASDLNRYPDPACGDLIKALAQFHGVESTQIAVAPGSLAALNAMMLAYCGEGSEVVYPWRSFEAYPILAGLSGAKSVTVPLGDGGRLDLKALANAITPATRVVMICTPNNPTGPSVWHRDFVTFMGQVPDDVLVAVDQAYAEFVDDPKAVRPLELLADWPNLVVFRTFSKAYGLAGLRLGYAIGPGEVIRAIRSATLPFSVSAVAQMAALVSLDRQDEMRSRVAQIAKVRGLLRQGLLDQGWAVPVSDGNFVWLEAGEQATPLAEACANAGATVRSFAGDGVRISAGEPESIERILDVTESWI